MTENALVASVTGGFQQDAASVNAAAIVTVVERLSERGVSGDQGLEVTSVSCEP